MTSQVTIKKEVEKLKERMIPKKAFYASGLYPCPNNEKGGPFGFCRLKIDGDNIIFEAATKEEELEGLKGFYERIVYPKKHMRKRYPTFEKWIEHEKGS